MVDARLEDSYSTPEPTLPLLTIRALADISHKNLKNKYTTAKNTVLECDFRRKFQAIDSKE